MTIDMGVCSTCGEPATMWVRDIQRLEDRSTGWVMYEPYGSPRRGCAAHPVYACEYDAGGKVLGRLVDDQGRAIPRDP